MVFPVAFKQMTTDQIGPGSGEPGNAKPSPRISGDAVTIWAVIIAKNAVADGAPAR